MKARIHFSNRGTAACGSGSKSLTEDYKKFTCKNCARTAANLLLNRPPLKNFRVKVWCGVTQHSVVVQARSAEVAMEAALSVLKVSYRDVKRMEAAEQ